MEYGEKSSTVSMNHAFKYYDVLFDSIIKPANENWNNGDLKGFYRMVKLLLISTHTLFDKKNSKDVESIFNDLNQIAPKLFYSAKTMEQKQQMVRQNLEIMSALEDCLSRIYFLMDRSNMRVNKAVFNYMPSIASR